MFDNGLGFGSILSLNQNVDRKKLTKFQNNMEWLNTAYNLLNIMTDAFEWTGLPDTCNARFLELALCLNGRACLVQDDDMSFKTLFAVPTNAINIYGEYDRICGYGYNGYNKEYVAYMLGTDNTKARAILIRDNNLEYPYYNYISMFASRLSDNLRTIDIASKKLKNPYFVTCEESQVNSVKKIMNDIDGNSEIVITSKATMPDSFKIFNAECRGENLKELWDNYNNLDNLIRTTLGINNNNRMDKKERLLVDEVNSNNEYTDTNLNMRLRQRQLFCEQAKELFGLDISVKIRYSESKEDEVIEDVVDSGTDL